jgi:hypothetical protein
MPTIRRSGARPHPCPGPRSADRAPHSGWADPANPTRILVSNQGTGGQRAIVPLTLKSGSDGRATAFVTPTEPGAGGVWYGATLFGF